ncbi:B3 domain-containing protein At3g19184-like [Rhododendron vialii]|uniref:B3 domain-containing protein At3g19184-like n=1 Tax=Rhododendron vialii TaxID=182163 RepID=UPI0026603A42|nr:B3 domain-containing protein At3g19184-like [Rhododendron vialii]
MVVSKASAYEESRLKRLEENKKRMEELNLNKLAQALSTPKYSPMKRVKPKVPRQPVDLSAVRRSGRVADRPPTSYKEEPIEPSGRARSYNRSYSYNRTNLANRVYASAEGRAYAIDRAEALQSGLESKFPSFVKPMLQSHVTGGFWLGLPVQFCEKHLPSHDEFIALLDEDDNESPTKYLAEKRGLSAGWRGFAIDHELVDGDALVFQLIEPTKFKVYIIRVNQVEDDDEAPNVTEVEVSTKRTRASRK